MCWTGLCYNYFFISGNFYFSFVSTSLANITTPKNKRKTKIIWDEKLTTTFINFKPLAFLVIVLRVLVQFFLRGWPFDFWGGYGWFGLGTCKNLFSQTSGDRFFSLTHKANCMAAISLKSVCRIIFSEIIHSLRSQIVGP